jgi:hypothetical protein
MNIAVHATFLPPPDPDAGLGFRDILGHRDTAGSKANPTGSM